MKVSLITVCYNAAPLIRSCIDSVLAQDHPDIEYIIVDGNSSDGTQDIVKSYGGRIAKFISEKDKGLYDAMNKGIGMATGEVVGIINADDFYASPGVISRVAREFTDKQADAVFGDIVYVREGDLEKVIRYFPGKGNWPADFTRGLMPPHPSFFVRRRLYEQIGVFDTSYKICADFDLMVRFLYKGAAPFSYVPETFLRMRAGGSSTQGLRSTLTINQEMLRSLRSHGVRSNLLKIYAKYFSKVFQLIARPS
jgi:glycosyltransferase involved in cell wall biosynthesis